MKRLYASLLVVLILLFVAFIIQNAEMVDLTFLVWGIQISKALLMMLCGALGFIIGLLAFSFKKSESNTSGSKPSAGANKLPIEKSVEN